MASNRIIRWRLIVEEYGPTFVHVQWEKNVVADALSRLDSDFEKDFPKKPTALYMAQCFAVTTEELNEEQFPMKPSLVAELQSKDKTLQKSVEKGTSAKYSTRIVEGTEVITYDGKIYIPQPLRQRVVAWYHEYLCHPGEERTELTIRQTLTWPKLSEDVRQHCKVCKQCQQSKKARKKYGHLPAREPDVVPWEKVHVDCI